VENIAVIGAGYVGLTTAVCLSSLGHSVVVSDTNIEKIKLLNNSICPIFEEKLEELLVESLNASRIRFITSNREAVAESDYVFLCLPTPEGDRGEADLKYVFSAIEEIKAFLRPSTILISKSTVPIGASLEIDRLIGRRDILYVSNPEFLREGTAVRDFLKPDRIVIGSKDREAAFRVGSLYSRITAPIIYTDPVSAETIKYASNSFLATKLSFINELASVCEVVEADADEVLRGMGLDSRIGASYLRPGPGWGGSCFPKDTKALLATSKFRGFEFELLQGVIRANDRHINRISERLQLLLDIHQGSSVAIFGLSFKAGTDDLRDSPAVEIAVKLRKAGISLRAYDPAISDLRKWGLSEEISLCSSPNEAVHGTDLVSILTEWPQFQDLDPVQVGNQMRQKVVFDGRLILRRRDWESAGFKYFGVGQP
jgi:UDPglucose 6-dehydrogenase